MSPYKGKFFEVDMVILEKRAMGRWKRAMRGSHIKEIMIICAASLLQIHTKPSDVCGGIRQGRAGTCKHP